MRATTRLVFVTLFLSHLPQTLAAQDGFNVWRLPNGEWYEANEAIVDPENPRRLVGKPGNGVLINGPTGKTNSLVTRKQFQDVQLHLEFMVAEGSNSGVSFHGNYEIQILDIAHVEKPTGAHCGGIYPRAEAEPTYHHIDAGSPPRVNAAKPPGQWQTLDIIFQSPRFDENGNKISNAQFVRVVHNGLVIQEDAELAWANGTNWDRPQRPRGPVIIQGDYGPIAIRNATVREWDGDTDLLNVAPEGFTSLFNGKDFTGWKVHPKVEQMWSIEDGLLMSPDLLEEWGADLVTEKKYRDYVLMVDFRMPTASDSGIHFRDFLPAMHGKVGHAEQLNLRSGGGTGNLESFHLIPEVAQLPEDQHPNVKPIDPEIGKWHTIKLTVVGQAISAEIDGDVIIDRFEYPDGILSMEPSHISFQKHRFVESRPGVRNPCPIEFRNIFIKELDGEEAAEARGLNIPPPGFTALFNGKDFEGWHTPPLVQEYWSVEDGVLKSPGLIETWGASLATKKHYRDFVLLIDFRMPTISDSGINFRRLIPEIPGFGDMEQFNLRSRGGMGHLESYYFLPKETAKKEGLKEDEKPHVRHIDPKVGVWHTVKLVVKGRALSAEFDGEVLYDNFEYHDWMMNMERAPIRLQKHIVVHGDNLGPENPCPIECRNIFIKELEPDDEMPRVRPREHRTASDESADSSVAELLARIDANDLPNAYVPQRHQDYVDRRMAELSETQRARIGRLWRDRERIDPDMPNRGFSFIKILEYIAENVK
jgi:hypothetical protein